MSEKEENLFGKGGKFSSITIAEDASCCKAFVRVFGMLILPMEMMYPILSNDAVVREGR